jgi:hypothetical protein
MIEIPINFGVLNDQDDCEKIRTLTYSCDSKSILKVGDIIYYCYTENENSEHREAWVEMDNLLADIREVFGLPYGVIFTEYDNKLIIKDIWQVVVTSFDVVLNQEEYCEWISAYRRKSIQDVLNDN